MMTREQFQANVSAVLERVHLACSDCGRKPESVTILPVTKTHPVEAAVLAWNEGFRAVGENRVQEALSKRETEGCPAGLNWELIGHLQSNKARDATAGFERIQSVDSVKLLRRMDRSAGDLGKGMRILLQVNAGEDPAKYGIPCAEAEAVMDAAMECEHLEVEGLMTIAPLNEDRDVARACFARLRETRDRLTKTSGLPLAELSMGMSGDLEAAVAEGSTLVRIGTALFGERA